MTVIFSKKCEYGMQAILYLAAQEKNTLVSAEEISRVLKIPREFISKILQSLRDSGLISSTKGKSGGFSLAKPASRIKLIDVVAAIDGLEMFDTCTRFCGLLTDSSLSRSPHLWVRYVIRLTICSLPKRLTSWEKKR